MRKEAAACRSDKIARSKKPVVDLFGDPGPKDELE